MKKNGNLSGKSKSHYRSWKSGKSWLYAATALAILVGAVGFSSNTFADTTTVPASTPTTASKSDAAAYAATASSAAQAAQSAQAAADTASTQADSLASAGTIEEIYSPSDADYLTNVAAVNASAVADITSVFVPAASSAAGEDQKVAAEITSATSLFAGEATSEASLASHFASDATSIVSSAVAGQEPASSDYALAASQAYVQASSANTTISSAFNKIMSAVASAVGNSLDSGSLDSEASTDALAGTYGSADMSAASDAASYAVDDQAGGDLYAAYDDYLSASMYAYDAQARASLFSSYASEAEAIFSEVSETPSSSSSVPSSSSSAGSKTVSAKVMTTNMTMSNQKVQIVPVYSKTSGVLPTTGDNKGYAATYLGLMFLLAAGGLAAFKKRQIRKSVVLEKLKGK